MWRFKWQPFVIDSIRDVKMFMEHAVAVLTQLSEEE
jgi:hypothetical protein